MGETSFIYTAGSPNSAGVDTNGDGVAESTDYQGYWSDDNKDGKMENNEWHHNMFTINDWLDKFKKMDEALGVDKKDTMVDVCKDMIA